MPPSTAAIVIEDRIVVPQSALDHQGYRAWVTSDEYPERLRTTFVCGEVLIEMTPESVYRHNQIKLALTTRLDTLVREGSLGRVYPDGVLITNEAAGLSCEPDLTFISWASLESGRVRLEPRVQDASDSVELVGSPDLVVEIVSDSSVRKDTRLLRKAYFSAGVDEYWLIDARAEDIRFEILGRSEEGFVASDARTSQVLGGRWELTRVLDRDGRFSYTLIRLATD